MATRATRTDWVQQSHTEFHEQVNDTWAYINPSTTSKLTAFGYGSNTPGYLWIMNTFKPALDLFNAAFVAWEDASERTKVKQLNLETTEKALKTHYRTLYKMFTGNVAVANADLESMEMPKRHSGGNVPVPAPTTRVRFTIKLGGPAEILLNYGDEHDTEGHAKPAEAHGAEFCYLVSDTMPLNWDELVHSVFSTRTPCHLTFAGDQRGKRVYIAGRWENPTGKKGPWSDILSSPIP